MDISCGIRSEIGLRPAMEDEYAIHEDRKQSVFSAEIYDGHGGRQPALTAAQMLTPHFLHAFARERRKPAEERCAEADLIRDAYLAVDAHLVGRRVEGGTCAVQLYLLGARLLAANAGDSRAVIGTREGATVLTEDHRPDSPAERSRIEALGGRVRVLGVPRVEGILAISRALGDPCLKPYVIADPRIEEGRLGSENDYAVLACDGVWDVLSAAEVMETVRQKEDPQKAADELTRMALGRGSGDNVTVIVLDLRKHTTALADSRMKILKIYDNKLFQAPDSKS